MRRIATLFVLAVFAAVPALVRAQVALSGEANRLMAAWSNRIDFGSYSVVGRLFSLPPVLAAEPGPFGDGVLGLTAIPNPVRSQDHVGFTLNAPGPARLAVYDALGRRVALLLDGTAAAGAHEVTLDAGRLAAGTYVLRLEAGGAVATRRVVIVR